MLLSVLLKRCTVSTIFGRRHSNDMISYSQNKRTKSGETIECVLCCKNNICNTGSLCGASSKYILYTYFGGNFEQLTYFWRDTLYIILKWKIPISQLIRLLRFHDFSVFGLCSLKLLKAWNRSTTFGDLIKLNKC